MTDLSKYRMWYFNGYATQPAGAPATMGMTIQPGRGNMMLVVAVRLGKDDYAAGRALAVTHVDNSNTYEKAKLMEDSIDNQYLRGLYAMVAEQTTTSGTPDRIGTPVVPYPVPGDDILLVKGASLANTETLTVYIHAYLLGKKPTVTAVGTGVVVTETLNEAV